MIKILKVGQQMVIFCIYIYNIIFNIISKTYLFVTLKGVELISENFTSYSCRTSHFSEFSI